MTLCFKSGAEWVSSALYAGRLEQAALIQLLIRKKIITVEEYLNELQPMAADDYVYSVREFVAQGEDQLRNGRWHIGGAAATDRLGRRLALQPDEVVLDVGCGVGGPARQIAEIFGCRAHGIDIRHERITEAILRTAALGLTPRVSFQVAGAERLPFENEAFDALVTQGTWNFVPDKPCAVREAFRVLKPGGRLGVECEARTEKAVDDTHEDTSSKPFRILAWQQLLYATEFQDVRIEEMWDESRQFYTAGPEREEIDRGERVNVRITARKP